MRLIPWLISRMSSQEYPKLSTAYYILLECLAQDHIKFLSTLEPTVFLYILESISEGLNALGEA
jgi:exportin-7